MANPVATALAEHFSRTWTMWRDAIENVPDELWRISDTDKLAPANHAYHMLLGVGRYTCDLSPDEYMSTRRHHLNWVEATAELPGRREMLGEFEQAERSVADWLTKHGDGGLLAEDGSYPHCGGTLLDRALYLLRHTQHHEATVQAELAHRGIARPQWR